MPRFIIILLLTFCSVHLFGQQFQVGAGYKNSEIPYWNKAIAIDFGQFRVLPEQVYAHGTFLELRYIFGNSRKLHSGLKADHGYMHKRFDFIGFSTELWTHFFQLGYFIEHTDFRNMDYSLEITAVSTMLMRDRRGEPIIVDGKRAAYGIGGKIGLNISGVVYQASKSSLSPFVGFGYAPNYYSRNSEKFLLDRPSWGSYRTQGLFWEIKLGVRVHFSLEKAESSLSE